MSAAPRRILLTGANGQVGWELQRCLAPLGEVVACTRAELDLLQPQTVRDVVQGVGPAAIVNAAAYTAVDRAESDRDTAFTVNAHAPAALAEEARALGIPIVHYSTDYVYAGDATTPYREEAPTAPLGVYGASKLAGDEGIVESGAAHLILRTCWVYAARGRNFLRSMLALAHERPELRVVADQVGSPTPARLIAEVTAHILSQHLAPDGFPLPEERWGVYHLAARGAVSWHEFATAIVEGDPQRDRQTARAIHPITTADYPTPARRPSYSVLNSERIERTFGVRMPDWREQLGLVLAEL